MIEKIYKEIQELDKMDPCSNAEAVCKFSEEVGEWIREINKTMGRKNTEESPQEIRENILEEGADSLQNHLLICSRFNITLEELFTKMLEKNQVWKEKIPLRQNQLKTEIGTEWMPIHEK